jgi:cytochrome c biogenesis protein CcmG/thiol:disulfide interchange protein DsbE
VVQTLKDVRRLPLSTVLLACVAAAAVSAIAVGILFGGGSGDEQSTGDTVVLEEGDEVTDVVGEQVSDLPYQVLGSDEETSLTAYAGRPMVVNFFASWCAPCVTEMPAFEQVHQQLGDQVAFVGLSTSDQEEATQQLVEDTGVTYDLGRDPRGDVLVDMGGANLPITALVRADGTIAAVITGGLTADELTERIQSDLLA